MSFADKTLFLLDAILVALGLGLFYVEHVKGKTSYAGIYLGVAVFNGITIIYFLWGHS